MIQKDVLSSFGTQISGKHDSSPSTSCMQISNPGLMCISLQDAQGNVSELKTTCESVSDTAKPKGFIHWVSSPISCEIRIYERLYVHKLIASMLYFCN